MSQNEAGAEVFNFDQTAKSRRVTFSKDRGFENGNCGLNHRLGIVRPIEGAWASAQAKRLSRKWDGIEGSVRRSQSQRSRALNPKSGEAFLAGWFTTPRVLPCLRNRQDVTPVVLLTGRARQ